MSQRARIAMPKGPIAEAVASGRTVEPFAVVGEKDVALWHKLSGDAGNNSQIARQQIVDERAAKHEASQQRVAKWPNTIDAIRVKNRDARDKRLLEEEQRRMFIDQEEAELKAAMRSLQIAKANAQLYETDDRVKNFNRNLLLRSVLAEREEQVRIAVEKKKIQKERDMHYFAQMKERINATAEADEAQRRARREREQAFRHELVDQLEAAKQQRRQQRREEMEEGRQLRQQAEEALAREQEGIAQRKQLASEKADQFRAELDAMLKARALTGKGSEEDAELERKIAAYHDRKQRQNDLRARHSQQRLSQRVDATMRATRVLEDVLQSDTDPYYPYDHPKKPGIDMQLLLAEEERNKKRTQDKAATTASREAQLQRAALERERRRHEKARTCQVYAEVNRDLENEEVAEAFVRRQEAQKTLRFQLRQIEEKRLNERHEKVKGVEERRAMAEAMDAEDLQFSHYVSQVLTPDMKSSLKWDYSPQSPSAHTTGSLSPSRSPLNKFASTRSPPAPRAHSSLA